MQRFCLGTMNVSSYLLDFSHHFTQVPPSSYPAILWSYYIQYLWNYEPSSWVARIASTCRILAILVSLPIIVLALLDISSYGIARTLGVIDDVKASTSDIATLHQNPSTPSIRVDESSASQSDSPFSDSDREPGSPIEHNLHNKRPSGLLQTLSENRNSLSYLGASQPQAFYASESDNLKLSGVGVFSPAASRPPSPVMTRKTLQPEGGKAPEQEQEQQDGLRQRVRQGVDVTD
ncbi:hypothetical protein D9615_004558 [Tricholomella constricta]|uniref:Uncharacterized protein n=1 Tax=Tricholomella constricta TaxID=117010 RepID=A0A8H5M432_9AGAR|nr:hypothetical protein D9615_004558 [Tricholomella constricta]